jgi:uncharacterized protein (DUF305 family)
MPNVHPKLARRAAPLALLAALIMLPRPAAAVIEPDYERGATQPLTTWYRLPNPSAMKVDQDYVAGMRPHHAGALIMSRDYLADPASSSPLLRELARAIIVNQQFEVLLLDRVAANLAQPPVAGPFGIRLQPMATEGVAQALLFRREPIPGVLSGYATGPVTARDVQFAKAMTIHHQGALDMARGYHSNPDARNGFLGLFNVDVIVDQSNEITLMRRVMAQYPGDASAIKLDPSMIHGMEGMPGHAGHAMPAAGDAAGPQAAPADPHAGHAALAPASAGSGQAGRADPAKQPPAMPMDHMHHSH